MRHWTNNENTILFQHLRPFYGGGRHGNAKPSSHMPKMSYLTQEEMLKDQAMAGLFKDMMPLMTTPKSLMEMMRDGAWTCDTVP